MRLIARKTLNRFIDSLTGSKDQKAVKSALDSWFQEVKQADWHNPADGARPASPRNAAWERASGKQYPHSASRPTVVA